MTQRFNWLHFSDLHTGLDDQTYLWPRFQTQLFDDLKKLADRAGPWHGVIFSGDLVQSGKAAEFDRLTQVVSQLWTLFKTLGCNPKLVSVPGNHDLTRPNSSSPYTAALQSYWDNTAVQKSVWSNNGEYKGFLDDLFSGYLKWRDNLIKAGVHASPTTDGIMPGDAAYQIDGLDCSTTVLCLNSTWLQLTGAPYEERLAVHPRQLMAITDDAPDTFLNRSDISLLVSHHPTGWLHSQAVKQWNNEIDPPGRFDAHLFGHMHVPSIQSKALGGSPIKRAFQAASLFGLEYVNGKQDRIQGYSSCRIEISDKDRTLTCWPRKLISVGGDVLKLAADQDHDLTEENCFVLRYEATSSSIPQSTVVAQDSSFVSESDPIDLETVSYHLPEAPAHLKVRGVEKQEAINALREDRMVWVSADWGMGEDGFLASVRQEEGHSDSVTIRFNFEEYNSRDRFFEEVRANYGWTFQQICDALPKEKVAYLIFDEIPVTGMELSGQPIDIDIEALASIVTDYSPRARIVLRSRRSPATARHKTIHLGPLEEPDVASYVRDSELGGERYSSKDVISTLYRHTDGVPSRLDALLRQLEVGSLNDLIASDVDISPGGIVALETPKALTASVVEIREAEDASLSRSFDMLKALSALPKGEQIGRLKRFYGTNPLYPSHALELLDRALIDSVSIAGIGDTDDPALAKALVVPRPVREHVLRSLTEMELQSLDNRALELYFGDDWKSGDVHNSNIGKRTRHPLCNANEIANANILIARTLNRAVEADNDFEIEAAIRLGSSYVTALTRGDHYRSAVALCDDILSFVGPTKHVAQMNVLRNERMGALRMAGNPAGAREAFNELDLSLFSKAQKQDALLELALAQESLRDESAVETANKIIALGKGSNAALQAEVIKAGSIKSNAAKRAELDRLLALADKRKSFVIANNIKVQLSSLIESDDPQMSESLLEDVINSSRVGKDYYNGARAVIKLAERRKRGDPVSDLTKKRLIEAYHFLYNERLSKLFDRCHRVLWETFEDELDTVNLLNLFRRSSFIWRLNGEASRESDYLAKLSGNFTIVTSNSRIDDRDRMYFVVRVTVVMGAAQNQLSGKAPIVDA